MQLTKAQYLTISKIAKRARDMAGAGNEYPHLDAMMDVEHAHKDCPLKLDELLAADDVNFTHDVFGIRRHLNRETKKLENCFVPRFAK